MLVWIDLEMTGLDHRVHRIVEIATVITDEHLETIIEGPNLVIGINDEDLKQMGLEVTEMHTKTGLLDRIKSSKLTLAQAEQQTVDFIKANVANPSEAPICGNSIGTDRRFLDEYMPKVEKMLHYRVVDVSSLRMVGEALVPDVVKTWRAAENKTDAVKHRALDDVHTSINELRYYYEHWLREPVKTGANHCH